MALKKVAIVGKTNVGKSQLFNRIVGEKHSIVLNVPGITRDRITLTAEWLKYKFLLTDTGGYSDFEKTVDFQEDINYQTRKAIDESDAIIFVISKKDLITTEDQQVAKILRKEFKKPVILAVNKCDVKSNKINEYEHINLGFGPGIEISAEHAINIGKLLDNIVQRMNIFNTNVEKFETSTKFAIIGKPNVGKSSICNCLLREDRLIVSPIAGTTRDAVDIKFSFNDQIYTLIDTAGIKKNKINSKTIVERLSIHRTKQSLKRANVICFVIDVADGIKELDERIGGLIFKANIPTIIIANKWDLIDHKNEFKRAELEIEIRKKLKYISWAPIIFVSAKNSSKLISIFKCLDKINQEMNKKIEQIDLNNFLARICAISTVPTVSNNKVTLYKIKQVISQIPTFLITCNNIKFLHFSFERMLENKFREAFDYKVSPIKIFYRSKKI